MAKRLLATIISLLPFVIFLALRLPGLTSDMTNSDAVRWHQRSNRFEQAIKKQDFSHTYQSYHPGVTLMWLTSGVEIALHLDAKLRHYEYKTLQHTEGYALIDGLSKTVLVFILFVLLIYQFRLITELFDRPIALLYVLLIAIEPYMIGINRWYHLTSLEVFLTFTAFLTFLTWADLRIRKYIGLSGVLFGLAVLTKFSSLVSLPVFLGIFLITLAKDKQRIVLNYLVEGLVFGAMTVLMFVIFFPAMWVAPVAVLAKLLAAGQNAQGGDYRSVLYAETQPYLFYLVVLLYKLSPITVILAIIALVKTMLWRERLAIYLLMYSLASLAILTFAEQKIERYILTFLPSLLLLCAIVVSRLEKTFLTLTLFVMLLFGIFTWKYFHPIYSSFYSPMFGGPKQAYALGIYDDSGEYYAKAAQYLNQKGRDKVVTVPNNVDSFAPYYKGKLSPVGFTAIDYFVSNKDSRRQIENVAQNCNVQQSEMRFFNYNMEVVTIYLCYPFDYTN
jgi:hypothetical protein